MPLGLEALVLFQFITIFPSARHQFVLQDQRHKAVVSHNVAVYSPGFAGTHFASPWRDGQAELTWVADKTPR